MEVPENGAGNQQKAHEHTYVQRLLQHNPSGLGLYFKVLQVIGIHWGRETVHYRSVVIRIFIRGWYTQDVCSDACVLFYIFDVFLKEEEGQRFSTNCSKRWNFCSFHIQGNNNIKCRDGDNDDDYDDASVLMRTRLICKSKDIEAIWRQIRDKI